jgi:4-hydroxy-tetrahydrodipicolinate synthase
MAGAGGYDTRDVIQAVRAAQDAGAHGILSVAPYYNRPTQEGLYQHYRAIADSTKLPVMVYNVPSRTGCNVEPATLARLAAIPNIVGIKEASGNVMQMNQICQIVPPGFLVLSGDDALALPLMAIGGRGLISVASNEIPAEMVSLIEAAERGDLEAARQWHQRLLPLMQINFIESNPIPVKFAMAAMGLCEGQYRLPMVPPAAASQDRILSALREFGMPLVTELRA